MRQWRNNSESITPTNLVGTSSNVTQNISCTVYTVRRSNTIVDRSSTNHRDGSAEQRQCYRPHYQETGLAYTREKNTLVRKKKKHDDLCGTVSGELLQNATLNAVAND